MVAVGIIALRVGGLYYVRRHKKQQELARHFPQSSTNNISGSPATTEPTFVEPVPQVINPTDPNTTNPPK
jgi:hypothetical protein